MLTPGTVMCWLAAYHTMRVIWIVRKYDEDGDLELAMSRMPLAELWNLQVRMCGAGMMLISAQVLAWLP